MKILRRAAIVLSLVLAAALLPAGAASAQTPCSDDNDFQLGDPQLVFVGVDNEPGGTGACARVLNIGADALVTTFIGEPAPGVNIVAAQLSVCRDGFVGEEPCVTTSGEVVVEENDPYVEVPTGHCADLFPTAPFFYTCVSTNVHVDSEPGESYAYVCIQTLSRFECVIVPGDPH